MASDRRRDWQVGIVVGLTAEARIARGSGCLVEIGGGTTAGAEAAVRRLIAKGATALLSFGLAGGLDPLLRPGTVLVPEAVLTKGLRIPTDAALSARLGGTTPHTLLGAEQVAASIGAKHRLWVASGCAAVDLESGAVALAAEAHGLPFAALRAICDPAERGLTPAALAALDHAGAIGLFRVIASVIGKPNQLPDLLRLGRDAAAARRTLVGRAALLLR